MTKKQLRALVLNLERCVGCFACELACKQENNMPIGKKWLRLVIIGPVRVNGKMCMDFILDISNQCNFCLECTKICPTQAIEFCDDEAKVLEALRDKGRRQVSHIQWKQ